MTTAQPGQEQRMETPPPIPNPPVRHGARRSPEDEALTFLRFNRDTHTKWAKYFEDNPEVEAEYLATGVWEGAADQRRVERQYNAAIATFERLAEAARPTADRLILYREALVAARPYVEANASRDSRMTAHHKGADVLDKIDAVLSRSGG